MFVCHTQIKFMIKPHILTKGIRDSFCFDDTDAMRPVYKQTTNVHSYTTVRAQLPVKHRGTTVRQYKA